MSKQDLTIQDPITQEVFMNRLRMLESNMNRLINQHQALSPLIDLIGLIPEVQKHKQSIQLVNQRLHSLTSTLTEFITNLRSSQQTTAIDFKDFNLEVAQAKRKIKQLEELSKKNTKEHLYKTKLKSTTIAKKVETRLQALKRDVKYFIEEFKQTLSNQFVKITESQAIESSLSSKLQQPQSIMNGHLQNLKREMGLLQCQIQFIKDKELRIQLSKSHTKQKDNVGMAILEHQFHLDGFVSFEQSNMDRIRYEFDILGNYLDKFQNMKSLQSKSLQLQYCKDRYYSLSNQIDGAKQNRTQQLMKLQNKLDRLTTLMQTDNHNQQPMSKLSRQLKQAREMSSKHYKLLEQHVLSIDEKIKQIQKHM